MPRLKVHYYKALMVESYDGLLEAGHHIIIITVIIVNMFKSRVSTI